MQESKRIFYIQNFYWYNALFWFLFLLQALFQDFSAFHYQEYAINTPYKFERFIYYPFGYFFTYWLISFFIIKFYYSCRKWSFKYFLWGNLIAAILISILVKFLSCIVIVLLERLVLPTETYPIGILLEQANEMWWDVYLGVFYYIIFLGAISGLDIYARYKNHFTFSAELESKLVKNQLQTLKMQLKPHFLFNALNTIVMMVRKKNEDKAIEMISGLSDMLRSTLSSEHRQFVTLEEELSLLRKYLAIEEVRYQDRLKLITEIQEETLMCQIPNLLLQPIVENAFKHGIAGSIDTETIRISAYINNGNKLQLDVFNTGSSLPPDWTMVSSKGIGVANTAQRLRQLYQGSFKFQVSEIEGGVLVRIILPVNKKEYVSN